MVRPVCGVACMITIGSTSSFCLAIARPLIGLSAGNQRDITSADTHARSLCHARSPNSDEGKGLRQIVVVVQWIERGPISSLRLRLATKLGQRYSTVVNPYSVVEPFLSSSTISGLRSVWIAAYRRCLKLFMIRTRKGLCESIFSS